MRRLPPGSYDVVRMGIDGANPFGGSQRSTSISDGQITVLDFGDDERIVLAGRAARGAEPIRSSLLLFSAANGAEHLQSTSTDGEGWYRIGLATPGRYHVVAQDRSLPHHGLSPVALDVPDEPEVFLDIVFGEGSIAGTVTDEDGRPVSGAMIAATVGGSAAGEPVAAQTVSADDGRWTLRALDDGVYGLVVMAPGFETWSGRTLEMTGGTTIDGIEVRLSRGDSIEGRLVDPAGAGVANALVFAFPSGSTAQLGSFPSQTDVNGRFRVVVPGDGPIEITAVASGWAPARATVSGRDDESLTLVASRGGRLEVRVLDGAARPVGGMRVVLRSQPTSPGIDWALALGAPAPTDADGATLAETLSPGAYQVSIAGREDVAAVAVVVPHAGQVEAILRIP
jgi:hypothetical protein